MKRVICTFLITGVFLTAFPTGCLAISGDTPLIPGVGNVSEKLNNITGEKIDLAPIKLPQKVYHFKLLEAERALAPNLLKDQIGLWSVPLRIKVHDLRWLIPVSGVLTALLLTDDDFSYALTNRHDISKTQTYISRTFAQIGGYAPVLSTPGVLLLTGALTKNDRLRETGVLQYEGIIDAAAIGTVFQAIAGRKKPNNEASERGRFFRGSSTSFPSGHSLAMYTLASIAHHQYPDKPWVAILAYTLASTVSASRITQGIHYPGDVFAGAALGYLIGRYIVKHRSKYSPKFNKDKEKITTQN